MAEYRSIIGLPEAQKRYTQKRFARASAVRFLALSVFFGAITAAELKSISVVTSVTQSL